MNDNNIYIKVISDFSDTPGLRKETDSENSGEKFLKTLLKPKFIQAIAENKFLVINLDDVEGYATSFLEESFGGLAREFGIEKVLNIIRIITNDEPYLEDEVKTYIKESMHEMA